MDGDDALADQILEQFQFGEYNNGQDLLSVPGSSGPNSSHVHDVSGAAGTGPPDIFNMGLMERGPGEVASCELVDLLLLETDTVSSTTRDRLGMIIPDDVNQFAAFPDKPWIPEGKPGEIIAKPPPPPPPTSLHHHHKRQPHHHFRHDRVQEPFNWSRIHDPIRRKKIERWKQKRDRIRSGLTVKHVYDVRVQHAIKRPRTGGRFVSASTQNAVREGTSKESMHEESTTTA